MRALMRLLWRAALFLWIRPRERIAVEDRHGGLEGSFGGGGVMGFKGLEHALDGGAQHGTLAGVAGIADDGLLGALLGGLDVGHVKLLKIDMCDTEDCKSMADSVA